ncbi:hypothetical protein ACFV4K_13445 [Nocardia sp. NPDC059764]|uniref:hypothetical protein n=1 Tax=Nocardia sp. NPDC059764 TaxID=3346939 RepID=UPI00364BCF88
MFDAVFDTRDDPQSLVGPSGVGRGMATAIRDPDGLPAPVLDGVALELIGGGGVLVGCARVATMRHGASRDH